MKQNTADVLGGLHATLPRAPVESPTLESPPLGKLNDFPCDSRKDLTQVISRNSRATLLSLVNSFVTCYSRSDNRVMEKC